MKKLLLVAGIFLSALGVHAQNQGDIGLDLYGGYTFGDKIYSNNATYLKFNENFQWGIGTEFYLRPTKSIELKYLRMDTKTSLYPQTPTQTFKDVNTNINYILVGGNNYFHTGNPSVVPFAGLGIGVGWVDAGDKSHTGFAWDFKAGVKIKASDVVSVKLQAYFQTIWASYGGQTIIYPGWGAVTYPNNSSLYQFGLGGAVSFDFKH
jgi:opacity protein-like surface antigen